MLSLSEACMRSIRVLSSFSPSTSYLFFTSFLITYIFTSHFSVSFLSGSSTPSFFLFLLFVPFLLLLLLLLHHLYFSNKSPLFFNIIGIQRNLVSLLDTLQTAKHISSALLSLTIIRGNKQSSSCHQKIILLFDHTQCSVQWLKSYLVMSTDSQNVPHFPFAQRQLFLLPLSAMFSSAVDRQA